MSTLNLCKCGCGGKTKKEYAYRHAPKMNICACGCEQPCNNKYIKGHCNKIKWAEKYTEEELTNRLEKHKNNYKQNLHSLESRKKAQENMGDIWNKGLTKEQMPASMYSEERNAKVGIKGNTNGFKKGGISWNSGLTKETDERVLKSSQKITGLKRTEEAKEKMRQNTLSLWANPEYKAKLLPKIGRTKSLNKKETLLLDILNKTFNNEWEYIGNGTKIIADKKPDFKHKEKNLLIELYGCYFHSCQICGLRFKNNKNRLSEQDRIDYFKQFGYQTLIIWEHELKNISSLINKLENFYKEVK